MCYRPWPPARIDCHWPTRPGPSPDRFAGRRRGRRLDPGRADWARRRSRRDCRRLKRAVSPALEEEHVAKAVAHEKIQEPRAVSRDDRQPGGIVADSDREGMLKRTISATRKDPDLVGIFHEYGEVERAIAVEVARDDRAWLVVDGAAAARGTCQRELCIEEAAMAVGGENRERVRAAIDHREIGLAVSEEVAGDQADGLGDRATGAAVDVASTVLGSRPALNLSCCLKVCSGSLSKTVTSPEAWSVTTIPGENHLRAGRP